MISDSLCRSLCSTKRCDLSFFAGFRVWGSSGEYGRVVFTDLFFFRFDSFVILFRMSAASKKDIYD